MGSGSEGYDGLAGHRDWRGGRVVFLAFSGLVGVVDDGRDGVATGYCAASGFEVLDDAAVEPWVTDG